jgi:hypothetical protein
MNETLVKYVIYAHDYDPMLSQVWIRLTNESSRQMSKTYLSLIGVSSAPYNFPFIDSNKRLGTEKMVTGSFSKKSETMSDEKRSL